MDVPLLLACAAGVERIARGPCVMIDHHLRDLASALERR